MTSYIKGLLSELTEPYDIADVKWRVGSTNKNNDRAMPLCYVDVRTVEQRLDDVVGPHQWNNSYEELSGGIILCTITMHIKDPDTEEIWHFSKTDGAGQTDFEGEKGGLSDAFKRASVRFGMGRYLYHIGNDWCPYTGDKYNPFTPDTLARLSQRLPNYIPKNSKARETYTQLTQEYRELTDKKKLLAWGDQRADLIGDLPEDWRNQLRKEYMDWLKEIAA